MYTDSFRFINWNFKKKSTLLLVMTQKNQLTIEITSHPYIISLLMFNKFAYLYGYRPHIYKKISISFPSYCTQILSKQSINFKSAMKTKIKISESFLVIWNGDSTKAPKSINFTLRKFSENEIDGIVFGLLFPLYSAFVWTFSYFQLFKFVWLIAHPYC